MFPVSEGTHVHEGVEKGRWDWRAVVVNPQDLVN